MSATTATRDLLRHIPKMDRLLAAPEIEALQEVYPRREVVERLRETSRSRDAGLPKAPCAGRTWPPLPSGNGWKSGWRGASSPTIGG